MRMTKCFKSRTFEKLSYNELEMHYKHIENVFSLTLDK